MWAKQKQTQPGFTIVELLIVIVIIGILAAITIVAYNGIQERARSSAAKSLLAQANKKVMAYQASEGSYPTDLTTAGVSDPSNLQYSVNNSSNPASYCLTATNGSLSYFQGTNQFTPQSGGCAGHGQGGTGAITNLAINPSLETTTSNWGHYLAGGAATASRLTTGGYSGSGFYRMTWTAATTAVSGGFYPVNMGSGNLTADNTYTASVWVRSSKNQTMRPQLTFRNAANTTVGTTINGGTVSVPANTWTQLSISGVAPATSNSALMTAYAHTGGSLWQPNDTLDGDAAMLTEGASVYAYADGNSPNWIWNGTQDNSSSTGPAI
ncbi:Fimbrial protein precursor [compost metagenome]